MKDACSKQMGEAICDDLRTALDNANEAGIRLRELIAYTEEPKISRAQEYLTKACHDLAHTIVMIEDNA